MRKILLFLLIAATMPFTLLATDCVCPCPCDPETPVAYSSDIVINELFPNPSTDESETEFIELKNTGTADTDLCSWQLKDASGKIYTFESTIIKAGEYVAIYRPISGIALNNSGTETLELYQPDGKLLYAATYSDSAQEDYSYSRKDDNSWQWTNILTPNANNDFSAVEPDPPEENINEPVSEPIVNFDLSKEIIISELYPNPNDNEDEFIELKNKGDKTVDLNGWQLQDAGNKTFTINNENFSSTKIDKFFLINKTISKISLNNDTDTIKLIQPDGNVLDSATYEKAEKGKSYNFKKDKWYWAAPTPGEINADENTAKTNPTTTATANIIITELLPDPDGSDSTDEYIEIKNSGKEKIDLLNWSLADSSRTFAWQESITLNPGQYQAFYITETKISLNNSGETITLKNPQGEVVSQINYDKATPGSSYSIDDSGTYNWSTTLTPGEKNIVSVTAEENTEEKKEENEYSAQFISEARTQEKGTKVQVEGVVSVLPGILGTQIFYIQDDESGIQVYSSKKDFPETLAIGDAIKVKGEMSEAYGEKKINIQTKDDVEIINNNLDLPQSQINELADDLEGMLVYTESQILELTSTKITLANGILVYIKSGVEFDKKQFQAGEIIKVIGIVGKYKDELRLMPRSMEDIAKTATVEEAATSSLINSANAAEISNNHSALTAPENNTKIGQYLVIATLGIFLLLAYVLYKIDVKKLLKKKFLNLLADEGKNTKAKDGQIQCRG